jgi:CDP-diacylglycerol pyrophosphatase
MAESLARPVPRDDVGLAINSEKGRTQNQLHIHVDCVNAEVIRALHADEDAVTASWAALPVRLAGHGYIAMRIEAPDLTNVNPFRLLADGIPAARADMGNETIVAIATTFKDGRDGFILLADRADLASGDRGSGEELLDHGCAILKQ